jgi:shikimate kinase
VSRLLEQREPVYQHADLTIASRDVPHDRIVEECIEALRVRLCGDREAVQETQQTTDGIRATP